MIKYSLRLLTIADIVLIIIFMICSAGSYMYLQKRNTKLKAYIYNHNILTGVYSLSKEQLIKINENCIAEIKDNKIRMLESDCPDKRCIRQGWSDLLPIICLPNQIVIEIKADNQKRKIHILN